MSANPRRLVGLLVTALTAVGLLAVETKAAGKPNMVYVLSSSAGRPGSSLTQLLEKYVEDGRSTPGALQKNDVPVNIHKPGRQPGKKGK